MSVRHEAKVFALELSIARSLCENIGSVRSLTVWLLLKYGEFDQLAALDIDPNHYDDSSAFADDSLVTLILSKNPRLPVSVNAEEVAIQRFWDAETKCAETNDRIARFVDCPSVAGADVLAIVTNTQRHIQRILGPLTRSKVAYAMSSTRFGPGATTSISGVVTQGRKYSHRCLDVTPRLLVYRTFGFPEAWKSSASDIRLRRSSKLRVVPKKATAGRTICIEPDLNIFVQLGQGALIRQRLLIHGLDLNTQVRNQNLAREGSISNDLCTMDLSSASDLISRSVVWLLLPYAWADFLHLSRVDFVESDNGQEVELSKWSSMGNGYTFELESLIFYCILLGAMEYAGLVDERVVAYGDDLIFPSQIEDVVRRTLEFLGFSVNCGKTFGKGSFRESCGTDWFNGAPVRPLFLKGTHYDFQSTCYVYANSIRSWASRNGSSCDRRCFPAWLRCVSAVDAKHRYRIPKGFGDVGFVSNWDEATPAIPHDKWVGQPGGFFFQYWELKAYTRIVSVHGAYLSALNTGSTSFSYGEESIRGRFASATTKRGYSLEWPNLGPWL